MRKQHAAYVNLLRGIGLEVELFKPSTVESAFLSDMALLLPEVAVVTGASASTHKPDVEVVTRELSNHRPIQRIGETGLLDGGDVLCIGRTLYVAETQWTSIEGISELRTIVQPFGYEIQTIELRSGRNLKAACTFIPPHFLVLNPAWVDAATFGEYRTIPVDESEPFAANTLSLAGTTLVSASSPKTEKCLRDAGIRTQAVNISEFEKIDGCLTRLVLIKEPRETRLTALSNQGVLKTVHVPKVPEPSGHASQAIVHGNTVYVTAQRAFDPSAANPPRMAVEEQSEHVLRNLAAVLASVGSTLADVLHATIHLADPKHLERIEAIYSDAFGGHRPTRSVISNKAMPTGVLVEIEVVAAVSKGRRP